MNRLLSPASIVQGVRARYLRQAIQAIVLILIGVLGGDSSAQALRGAPLAGTFLEAQAVATYTGLSGHTELVYSPLLRIQIQVVEGFRIEGDTWVAHAAGSRATLSYSLTNQGNAASQYQFNAVNTDHTACGDHLDNADLGALQVVLDSNGNGWADAHEIAADNTRLVLQPGQAASVLVLGDVPLQSQGGACIALTANTAQSSSQTAHTFVSMADNPVMVVRQAAEFSQALKPGVEGQSNTANWVLTLSNNGTRPATTVSELGTTGRLITVDGVPTRLVLLTNPVPQGALYIRGSLISRHPRALLLFRQSADAPEAYSTTDPGRSAIEVAVGYPFDILVGQSVDMEYKIMPADTAGPTINSVARVHFGNVQGVSGTSVAASNMATVPVAGQRLGVAHWVVDETLNRVPTPQPDGSIVYWPDGTVTYTLALRVRNEGTVALTNVQLPHDLYGLGTFTPNELPGAGQYTVVAGSLHVHSRVNSATKVQINPFFTGQGDQNGLLPMGVNGSLLPVGGEWVVHYAVRVNVANRSGLVVNSQVNAQASLHTQSVHNDAMDTSTQGPNPDPDFDGNPNNNQQPTLLVFPDLVTHHDMASGLSIHKRVSQPLRISQGVYELTYTIDVKNNSAQPIHNVRVIDNLACSFNVSDPSSNIASWSLQGQPQALKGTFTFSSVFGSLPNGRCSDEGNDWTQLPTDPAHILNRGNETLGVGQSETLMFTVRITQRDLGVRSKISNRAWVVAYNSNELVNNSLLAASADTVESLLVDPQGYVYESVTRQAISGATVTVTRLSCDSGVVTPITSDQVFNGDNGLYTFSGNSMSMVTGADGQYQFFWRAPPVNDICSYSIAVTPPSGYQVSTRILPESTEYTGCRFVVPNNGVPTGTDPTTWHERVRSGYNTSHNPNSCEVLHNNIPLDSLQLNTGLLLAKEANKRQAELGDVVEYTLTLSNRLAGEIREIAVADVLPPGFTYVPGSAKLVGGSPVSDPVQQVDTTAKLTRLTFSLTPPLAAQSELKMRYLTRIGIGAQSESDAINTARVTAVSSAAPMPLASNRAQHKLFLSGGVLGNQGFAIGRVWADCNRNGVQETQGEPGVAGVRLYLQDGTSVISDAQGRWSLYGLQSNTHVLRVDTSTLPSGAKLRVIDNRQAQQAHSRFIDVKHGSMVRADFAVDNCQHPGLLSAIEQRNTHFADAVERQLEALVSARMPTENRVVAPIDRRAGPAVGVVAQVGQNSAVLQDVEALTKQSTASPLIALPSGTRPVSGLGLSSASRTEDLSETLLGPVATLSAIPLEQLIQSLPAKAAFVELKDGDTLISENINIRVTGPQQSVLRLKVNGQLIPDNRVGKKAVVTASGLVAYEFVAIRMQPGINTLVLEATDEWGNVRETVQIAVRAPGRLGRVSLKPDSRLSADPLRPATIQLQLTDKEGVPVTARTSVTLRAQGAKWLNPDLNPNEPGVQIFVQDGRASLTLQGPAQPGEVRVQVTAGPVIHEETLRFLPALSTLQGVGLVEGVLDLSRSGRLSLQHPQASNAFETELQELSLGSGQARASGRVAFYLKGAIKGEYLLTAAYDSEKTSRERLFRDIRPEEFYPVYGDGSVRGFDAQSSGKLYVRIDKERSFVLLGDFNTASSAEVRQLSQYSRNLSGIQHRYEDERVRITSFAAETSAAQQVQEIPANGLSIYNFKVSGVIKPGSDSVELWVRDKSDPQRVISQRKLVRMVDYSFEPLTGRLTLAEPIATLNSLLHPQSIRITFELESDDGAPTHRVLGTDVQVKVNERLQIGAALVHDDHPLQGQDMRALTALARLGEHTELSAEVVQSESQTQATRQSGHALRATLKHSEGPLQVQAQIIHTEPGFKNIGSPVGAGRTELTAQSQYTLSTDTQLRATVTLSQDQVDGSTTERQQAELAVAHKLNDHTALELGVRQGRNESSTADQQETTGRARITLRPPQWPRLQTHVELEKDLRDNDRNAVGGGVTYGVTDSTRVYSQFTHSNLSTQVGQTQDHQYRQTWALGLDSAYMEGGRVYNELRTTNDGSASNAAGVRNTFKLGQWRLSTGLERVHTKGNATTGHTRATTATLGADWAVGPYRLSTALEERRGTDSHGSLYSIAGAWRLNDDVTLLARLTDTQTRSSTQRASSQRQHVGVAWRPAAADRWNFLGRYEHRNHRDTAASGLQTQDHILSTHAHWQINRQEALSLRWAGKWTHTRSSTQDVPHDMQLLLGRYTHDLTSKWDIGLQAARLWDHRGAHQDHLGVELGYQALPGLWVSVGYNALGLNNQDLSGPSYTSQGAFVRLRWKFDESLLPFGRVTEPTTEP